MLPPLKIRHIGRLRTEVFRVPSTFTTPLASMVGRRLFSVSQYSVEPVPRDLIPSISGSKPQVLWLGCSDSGYEETTILDLIPEEMIVVRNCGNMALANDLSWSSAVQYAVNNLQGMIFPPFPIPSRF
jgi:carbonic anhydrase